MRNYDYRLKGEKERTPWRGEECGIDKIKKEEEKIEVKRLHPLEAACDDRTDGHGRRCEAFTRTMGTKILRGGRLVATPAGSRHRRHRRLPPSS